MSMQTLIRIEGSSLQSYPLLYQTFHQLSSNHTFALFVKPLYLGVIERFYY